MEQTLLKVQKRESLSKGKLKDQRKQGFVPAIMYGADEAANQIFINEVDMKKLLAHGTNILVKLNIDGKTEKTALIKEIQKDALTSKLLHVDFHVVSLKEKIEIAVPIHVTGEAPGVKAQGGVLSHVLREVRVRCLPTEIPQFFEADISNLNMGESILLKDLKISKDIEVLSDTESIIVNIIAPMKEEAVAATPETLAATPTEPEVISKGKKEEEGEGEGETAAPAAPGDKTAKPAAKAPEPAKTDKK